MGLIRERIYNVIDCDVTSGTIDWYGVVSVVATIASIVPMAFRGQNPFFEFLEIVVTAFFTIDYLLRWLTTDLRRGKGGFFSFLTYPLTPAAIIDLVSLLPTYLSLNASFKLLRAGRLIRLMKVTRVFKAMRYSSSVMLIGRVLRRQRDSLVAVSLVAMAYVLISALLIFNVEPGSFESFFDAVYWATVSLTTVGYGDIYPVTVIGRCVTMLSSLFGVAVVALPASIITAGFMEELEGRRDDDGQAGEPPA